MTVRHRRKHQAKIIGAAERTFDYHGFTASGVDRLAAAANVLSRTLHKHFENTNKLMAVALEHWRKRFFSMFNVDTVDALFT